MRCTFRPRLVNGWFEDPVLFVDFAHQHRALLFDVGNIGRLPPRDLLKVSHVFVSHTHMDHFCGFDRLLRVCLGRSKQLWLCGPQGFLANLAGKLAGYRWDLVASYSEALGIEAVEVHAGTCQYQRFECRLGFIPDQPPRGVPFDGCLVAAPDFSVTAAVLQHSSTCLGFRLDERFHVNILKPQLDALGLKVGPWINRFKAALYAEAPGDSPVTAMTVDDRPRTFRLAELAEAVARVTAGQRIAYVTDVADTPDNHRAITALIQGVDQLYIEAAFLQCDAALARRRHHLTAARAGELAGRAAVKEIHLMHFSPRYTDRPALLVEEARRAFHAARSQPLATETPTKP
ncbi:MAG: MBL fold metallo-hydrolase [Desulfobacterales bacterium]|jgi:ribonuclease Z|nr:MBL fold metallo-hydrolase [Desulfobacteraceae bacterium]MDY0312187.1 MBL fold metallo-hydrolase [Desulfobacterales bacterium]